MADVIHKNLSFTKPDAGAADEHRLTISSTNVDEDDRAQKLVERFGSELEELATEIFKSDSSPAFIGLVMGHLSSHARMDFFRVLTHSLKPLTFMHLRPSEQSILIEESDITDCEAFIAGLPDIVRLDTLQSLSYGAVQKISHCLRHDEKASVDITRLFPQESVGRVMHRIPPAMCLLSSLSVEQALMEIRKAGKETGWGNDPRRSGGMLLIRDAHNKMVGWTDLATLLRVCEGAAVGDVRYHGTEVAVGGDTGALHEPIVPLAAPVVGGASVDNMSSTSSSSDSAPAVSADALKPVLLASGPTSLLSALAYPLLHTLQVTDDVEEMLRVYSVAEYSCIPVVDGEGVLQGVVRGRDAVKLYAAKLAAAGSSDTGIKSYSKSSVLLLVRKRIVWLLILAALNFGVAAVVGSFEEILSKNLVLAGFIPLLAGMGGNIGAQTTGLVISAVASRDIARTDVMYVLKKEVWVGLWISAILGLVAALMGYIRATGDSKGPIALVIGASMAVVSLIANMLGVFMPFGSLATGQDPAVSSSPLITTAIDVIGISLYLALAQVILANSLTEGAAPPAA